jgi:hypothetical protein
VADDWDLMVRMFMRSSCYHISKFLYVQRHGLGNTQTRSSWNEMIQYELQLARNRYHAEFVKFIESNKWRAALPGKDGQPKMLTIAIPTWNRHERLFQLLGEIDYPEIAIKVISDGHDHVLQQRLTELAEKSGRDLQYLFTPASTKPAWGDRQRQFACEFCDTRYLWLVDDDNSVYEGAVDAILDRLENDSPDALFVAIDYNGEKVLPGSDLRKIAPTCEDDLQPCFADTMNVIFQPARNKWAATGYHADWEFVDSIKSTGGKLAFASDKTIGQWRRD